jgi:SAM-dependent methyltransferase
MENIWNKKAHRYNRYTPGSDMFESEICSLIGQMGIEWSGQKVLDIGCGTGVYTLRIAQKSKTVDALDISEEMLSLLNKDAKQYDIENIQTRHSNWEEFELPVQKWDIAISTMSPATRTDDGFDKMHRSARTKIFLGWGDKRGTALLEELFEAHGALYTPPSGGARLTRWLKGRSIPYKLKKPVEEKVRTKSIDNAIESCALRLEAHDLHPDRNRIYEVLQNHLNNDGKVVERVTNYFNLIIWQ